MNKTSSLSIGVSGHQHLGDESTHQFRELLLTYLHNSYDITLYAALAVGTDQLFVQIALDPEIPVEIILPCAEYETTFSTEQGRNEYTRLLHACHTHHALPAQQCSDDAFLAAGQWIVDHSDLLIVAWNGLPPQGRGGTGDVASYARTVGCPYIHIDTRHHHVKRYGHLSSEHKREASLAPKHAFTTTQHRVYQGPTLAVNQYRLNMPDGTEVVRDVLERPESVLIVPVAHKEIVLLIEEYDFGAGAWQLKLPGGKIEHPSSYTREEQAQKELRQEIGYRAQRLEKLIDFHSHLGYISHKVHAFVAQDLEWDPLAVEPHEEIRVHTSTLKDALAATLVDGLCDPEASLLLWLYAQKRFNISSPISAIGEGA